MVLRFEWNSAKAASNLRKHDVSFETAARVFSDPQALLDLEKIEDGEERWRAIGTVAGHLVLVVVHTVREEDEGEAIRIISARRGPAAEAAL